MSTQNARTIEVGIRGMDCHECTEHVRHAIAGLPGVNGVDVFLSSEKAVINLDPAQVSMDAIRTAVAGAGYSVPETESAPAGAAAPAAPDFTRSVLTLFGIVFVAVLLVVIVGEWLGAFGHLTELVPLPIGILIVAVFGFPVFRNVVRATLHRQVIAHTLMSVGVLAALAVGEWATATVVVFFMRVGDYAERFTTERARRAVKDLTALAPLSARVERDGEEHMVPVGDVRPGDTVVVRPGEQIPVDGEVMDGHATVDQATITGESLPVDAGPGAHVYATTHARAGRLRVRVTQVGRDTTFGRVVHLVEEAEAHRANVQRIADRFSAWYMPVVASIAVLTFILRRDPLATASVLVVACSCAFALATPIALLASVGAGAKRGILIKGGKYLEALAQADVLLLDKTGTLTLGQPQITECLPLDGLDESESLRLAASAERYSEHPLADAIRRAAAARNLSLSEPEQFEATAGVGVSALVDGHRISIGRNGPSAGLDEGTRNRLAALEAQGKTVMLMLHDGVPSAAIAAADTLRPEVPRALAQLRALNVNRIELLTGDNERAAATLAQTLGVTFRANLLPQDKIAIVREYQSQGRIVAMVGDGVNDAPALAQAHVGIAMGAAGATVAMEAAHIALMREDWMLVPGVFRIARRTLSTIRMNIVFTLAYNAVGLTLAAFGILPPIAAAAAQSLPDLGILANSSRLIRQK